MASQNVNIENLTTDACPSPPRDENESNMNTIPEEKVREEPPLYTGFKKRKTKARKTPTHAVAHITNINNSNGIHIGSNFTINMGNSQTTERENIDKKIIRKTDAICKLLERSDPVTKEIISFVSEHIGKNWKVAARALGYSDGQLYQFEENNNLKGIREVVYQILLDWIQNKPEEAKVGVLFSTLWDSSEKDVVQRMAHTN